ncbi:hypothetical protein [Xanthobacter variabilis]|uniref:hypothetical protein n=1 Tax=Xanthobacter variabilis TaxID=3119932 RepID=UPI00374E8927
MSDDHGSSQGVHYHYHFYGYGPGEGFAPQGGDNGMGGTTSEAGAQDGGQDGAQRRGGRGMGGAQGGQGAGGPAAGAHGSHGHNAGAGAVPPGFPPPGFPFAPGGATGTNGAQGAQSTQAGTGFNWHQHPAADSLIKGLVVGAGAAYLLTNETAQRTILRTAVQVWSFLQGSVEELKERLHDAEAEVAAATAPAAPAEPTDVVPAAPPASES